MDKYLARRWKRAQQYTTAQVAPCAGIHTPTPLHYKGWWYAPSSMGGEWHTHAHVRDGVLYASACNCPDYGECTWNGVPVCKHVLALALWMVISQGEYIPGLKISHTLGYALKARGQ